MIRLLRDIGERLRQLATLEVRVRALRAELDALRSSMDVPTELAAEFHAWRAANRVAERPLVSICIATYNRAELLTTRSIPSVLSQTYPHLELIVVGDGCTDQTANAIAAIPDSRIRFVNLPQRGSYPDDPIKRWMVAGTPAINHAMRLCQGDFVTHLDDDDEYTPDRLEKLVEFAVQEAADFVWHPFWVEQRSGRWWLNPADELAQGFVTTSSVFYRSWFTRIEWDPLSYVLHEPGDSARFRRIRHIGPRALRYPEPLLRHYRERNQRT